ncbi:hypothetical protein F5887DRAFT_1281386 [Amanita rubescens]|nr:hypothetical protein F5887DRAFT_1281386 [Amanita rubescens]
MSETKLQPRPKIRLPPVPDNLRDRKAEFGYLINDDLQRNYYKNMGVEDVMTPGDYHNKHEKEAM